MAQRKKRSTKRKARSKKSRDTSSDAGADVVEIEIPEPITLCNPETGDEIREFNLRGTLKRLIEWLDNECEDTRVALREAAQAQPKTVEMKEVILGALNQNEWKAEGVKSASEAQRVWEEFMAAEDEGRHMRIPRELAKRLRDSARKLQDWTPLQLAQLKPFFDVLDEAPKQGENKR